MRVILLSLVLLSLASCTSSRIVTLHQTAQPLQQPFNRIVVIAITADDSMRTGIERAFVSELVGLGYASESAADYFGIGGLANLGEEGTYLKFCDEGVDAILTIVPVVKKNLPRQEFADPLSVNAYYYNRIWQYPRIRSDAVSRHINWEAVLFDLVTLSPQFAGFKKGSVEPNELALQFVTSMKEAGILKNWKEGSFKPRPF